MAQTVLTLGQTGLVAGDLSLRYFLDGVLDATGIAAAMTLAEIGSSGDYVLGNLPDLSGGSWGIVTWETPDGVYGFHVYPKQLGAPPNLVLPIRESGLLAADFDFAIYKDGVPTGDTIASVELDGGYRVSGWATDEAGSFVLVWRRYGISYYYGWDGRAPDAHPTLPASTSSQTYTASLSGDAYGAS